MNGKHLRRNRAAWNGLAAVKLYVDAVGRRVSGGDAGPSERNRGEGYAFLPDRTRPMPSMKSLFAALSRDGERYRSAVVLPLHLT
jgi:hypothetical protein